MSVGIFLTNPIISYKHDLDASLFYQNIPWCKNTYFKNNCMITTKINYKNIYIYINSKNTNSYSYLENIKSKINKLSNNDISYLTDIYCNYFYHYSIKVYSTCNDFLYIPPLWNIVTNFSYLETIKSKINKISNINLFHNDIIYTNYLNIKNVISFKNIHKMVIFTGNKRLKIINSNIKKFKLKLATWNKASKHHHSNHTVIDGIISNINLTF